MPTVYRDNSFWQHSTAFLVHTARINPNVVKTLLLNHLTALQSLCMSFLVKFFLRSPKCSGLPFLVCHLFNFPPTWEYRIAMCWPTKYSNSLLLNIDQPHPCVTNPSSSALLHSNSFVFCDNAYLWPSVYNRSTKGNDKCCSIVRLVLVDRHGLHRSVCTSTKPISKKLEMKMSLDPDSLLTNVLTLRRQTVYVGHCLSSPSFCFREKSSLWTNRL